mmetsp:Transcript_48822/g.145897  ORF Transcript_48822/g.145897 Transcript_48822/m.145897 type:complete len:227 (-) Transcript_48822:1386-2066(-)
MPCASCWPLMPQALWTTPPKASTAQAVAERFSAVLSRRKGSGASQTLARKEKPSQQSGTPPSTQEQAPSRTLIQASTPALLCRRAASTASSSCSCSRSPANSWLAGRAAVSAAGCAAASSGASAPDERKPIQPNQLHAWAVEASTPSALGCSGRRRRRRNPGRSSASSSAIRERTSLSLLDGSRSAWWWSRRSCTRRCGRKRDIPNHRDHTAQTSVPIRTRNIARS